MNERAVVGRMLGFLITHGWKHRRISQHPNFALETIKKADKQKTDKKIQ